LHVMKLPVELDVLASADLLGCGLHHGSC
jgi:hypothetical protein